MEDRYLASFKRSQGYLKLLAELDLLKVSPLEFVNFYGSAAAHRPRLSLKFKPARNIFSTRVLPHLSQVYTFLKIVKFSFGLQAADALSPSRYCYFKIKLSRARFDRTLIANYTGT